MGKDYRDVKGADSLTKFLVDVIPEDAQFLIYKNLRDKYPELIGPTDASINDPIEVLKEHVSYLIYTAAYNLGQNLVREGHLTEQQFEQDFLGD